MVKLKKNKFYKMTKKKNQKSKGPIELTNKLLQKG